jgi:hypothetical protein
MTKGASGHLTETEYKKNLRQVAEQEKWTDKFLIGHLLDNIVLLYLHTIHT